MDVAVCNLSPGHLLSLLMIHTVPLPTLLLQCTFPTAHGSNLATHKVFTCFEVVLLTQAHRNLS